MDLSKQLDIVIYAQLLRPFTGINAGRIYLARITKVSQGVFQRLAALGESLSDQCRESIMLVMADGRRDSGYHPDNGGFNPGYWPEALWRNGK